MKYKWKNDQIAWINDKTAKKRQNWETKQKDRKKSFRIGKLKKEQRECTKKKTKFSATPRIQNGEMACLNTLKLEIKTLERTFTKNHERFRILHASVDELTCRFIGKNGKNYDIHANITVIIAFHFSLSLSISASSSYSFFCGMTWLCTSFGMQKQQQRVVRYKKVLFRSFSRISSRWRFNMCVCMCVCVFFFKFQSRSHHRECLFFCSIVFLFFASFCSRNLCMGLFFFFFFYSTSLSRCVCFVWSFLF